VRALVARGGFRDAPARAAHLFRSRALAGFLAGAPAAGGRSAPPASGGGAVRVAVGPAAPRVRS
jgi:hypothetical protein